MSLKNRILEDVKVAMRARERERLLVLRSVTAAIKQIEIDQRIVLDDTGVLAVLDKMSKQRRESLEQYEKAGREDLASQERYELDLLKDYMPEPLAPDELSALISQAIEETGATSMRDMGAVMAHLKEKVQGRADMKAVSGAVRENLNA